MLTEKQLAIFEPLVRRIFRECTIKEIKEESMEKSNNAINLAIKKFKEEKLVRERNVGRSKLYTLNKDNIVVFNYVDLINKKKLSKLAKETIEQLSEEIKKYTSFFIVVIFGSYSVGKQKKNSDLDIAVFVENEKIKNKIQFALNSAKLKSIQPIDPHAISQEEFIDMLKADYENLGKEIARKHLSIHNSSVFYDLLNKGIKNGFNL